MFFLNIRSHKNGFYLIAFSLTIKIQHLSNARKNDDLDLILLKLGTRTLILLIALCKMSKDSYLFIIKIGCFYGYNAVIKNLRKFLQLLHFAKNSEYYLTIS